MPASLMPSPLRAVVARRAHRLCHAATRAVEVADLIQEAEIAFWQVGLTYNGRDAALTTYASRRVLGAIVDAVRRDTHGRSDGRVEHGAHVQIDDVVEAQLGEACTAERGVMLRETIDALPRILTDAELRTLTGVLAGDSEMDIARREGLTSGAVSQRVSSATRKLMRWHAR